MREKEVRALLFDFGGTLDANGIHWRERAYRFIQKRFSHLSRAEFEMADRVSVRRFITNGNAPESSLRETADAIFTGVYEELQLDLQVKNLFIQEFCQDAQAALNRNRQWLKTLSRDFKLGVISNNFGNTAGWCDEYAIAPLLEVIVDSTVIGIDKPNTAIFQAALSQLGIAAEEAIFVGDTYLDDVVGAKNTGMRAGWLGGDEFKSGHEIPAADFYLARLQDLDYFLKTCRRRIQSCSNSKV